MGQNIFCSQDIPSRLLCTFALPASVLQFCWNDGPPLLKLKLSPLPTLFSSVIHPLLLVDSTAKLFC